MKFGCCTSIDNAAIVHESGFDYIECTVVSMLGEEDEATFAPVLAQHRSSAIPTSAFNVFLPRTIPVVGPEVDQDRVKRYVDVSLRRARSAGAKTVVFGSGGSRSIPEGFSRADATEQIVDFLKMVGPVAAKNEITIAIEPLNKRESNIINSVTEGVEFAEKADHPAIRVLADFYHMDEDNEPLDNILKCKDWLAHIHVADTDRGAPGTGSYPYAEFVSLLQQAGYDGMVSIECRWDDFATQLGPSGEFLRKVFGEGFSRK
ncbi:sugar phosphate isomerase/epimerase [Chloroflexi bacterium TSY]|nr:sugar phosphate isomerase/epimerase [Chloroflexi bacterium TSY]